MSHNISPDQTLAATLRAAANGDPDACAWLRCLAPDLLTEDHHMVPTLADLDDTHLRLCRTEAAHDVALLALPVCAGAQAQADLAATRRKLAAIDAELARRTALPADKPASPVLELRIVIATQEKGDNAGPVLWAQRERVQCA